MKKNKLDLESVKNLHHSGQLDAAKKGYLQLLRINPRHVEALHGLAIAYAQQDHLTEAIEYLQKALQYEPHNPVLSLHLANLLKFQGLFSQAVQVLESLLQSQPDYAPAFNNLGTVYYAQAKLEEAVHCYQTAIAKQPNYVDAFYNLGLALSKQNKISDAIETYKKLLDWSPDHQAARFHLACLYMQEEKFDEAIENFLLIEKIQPNHFETQSNLATSYLKKGMLDQARMHYNRALELMPHDTQILFNLGVINMQLGLTDLAIQYYQRLTEINPNDFAVHNNLGVAFLAKQHLGFASHHFQEALRLQPNNTAIQHILKMLSQQHHLLAAPPEYIQSLFDAYADHYDKHLLATLDYKIPQLFRLFIEKIAKPQHQSLSILDLGCGTGLCGEQLKPFAKQLVGVDLSSKMLEVARENHLYDELICSDVSTFLQQLSSQYDLILAGDVLVYIGDLDTIFNHAQKALRSEGIFIFNTEIIEKGSFIMTQSGRFAHSKNYLDQLAKKYHFAIKDYDVIETRKQNNEPVLGHLYVLMRAT